MFGLESLDIMIGLITVYLIFGMACTAFVEAVMSWNEVRSKNLEAALKEFLHNGDVGTNGGKDFVKKFYDHALVQSLSKGVDGRPSYLPPEIVSQVVIDIIKAGDGGVTIEQAIKDLPKDSRIQSLLISLYKQANNDVTEFRKGIETHFDNIMDRASGWVKRDSRNITRVVSVLLVVSFNVDTINIYNSLANNPTARLKLIEISQQLDKSPLPKTDDSSDKAIDQTKKAEEILKKATNELESAGVQLGWDKDNLPEEWGWDKNSFGWLINKILGLLISTLAVSLGAPFWFDILQKFMQIRSSGVSPRDPKK
ncbi:MAG: hypothetical protein RIQ94_2427 [Pseudomonadota bacterium]|jgi:hypothetical protein